MFWLLIAGAVIIAILILVVLALKRADRAGSVRDPLERAAAATAEQKNPAAAAGPRFVDEVEAVPLPADAGNAAHHPRSTPPSGGRSIIDARLGDTISLPGDGPGTPRWTVTLDQRSRYESEDDTWIEWSGNWQGRRVAIEVAQQDGLEISADPGGPPLRLADLGLTEDDLIRMDESQDESESIIFHGARYRFEWSGEVFYYEGDRGEGESCYLWEFAELNGNGNLGVEKWEGEDFEVRAARYIAPQDVEIH